MRKHAMPLSLSSHQCTPLLNAEALYMKGWVFAVVWLLLIATLCSVDGDKDDTNNINNQQQQQQQQQPNNLFHNKDAEENKRNNNNKKDNIKLQFNSNGTFKIVHFTDLHFGGSSDDDEYTIRVQNTVLDEEKPDLVIITGDLVSGYLWNRHTPHWFYANWIKLIQPMVSHNREIIALDSSHVLSLTQSGPTTIAGAGNYYLPIYNSSDDILWMFDSGNRACMGVPGWGCIQTSQISWYKNESSTLTSKNHSPIPSMAFFHLWNSRPVYGRLGEDVGVCCSSVNTGLYTAMKEMNDIKHVFCGHDHSNDYYGDYFGIYLGYGRKTGYGSYGPPPGWKHGARIIEIHENEEEVNTWLRLEDKSIEIQQIIQPGSSRWVGCCDMEGRDIEASGTNGVTDPTYSGPKSSVSFPPYLFLFNAVWLLVVMTCMCAGHQCYLRYSNKFVPGSSTLLIQGWNGHDSTRDLSFQLLPRIFRTNRELLRQAYGGNKSQQKSTQVNKSQHKSTQVNISQTKQLSPLPLITHPLTAAVTSCWVAVRSSLSVTKGH